MSEQPKDQNSFKQGETAKLDAAAASAALALAVTSAEKSSAQPAKADGEKAQRPLQRAQASLQKAQALGRAITRRCRPQASAVSVTRKHAAQAAAVALAIALGWAGGSQTLSGARHAHADAAGSGIRHNEDIARLTSDVGALKSVIQSFKDSFEQAQADAAAHNRSLLERIETVERAGQDAVAKIVRVAEASERIERAGAEAKLAAVNGRAEPVPAVKPAQAEVADPAPTGSVPDAQSANHTRIEGWVLREVYDGAALVEARNGRLHEVAPGRNLPSVGRVKSIERRGKIWVVVTAKGIIAPPERWH